ncbi:5463_t:CDS:2 [Funneliformis geosporum]|uniref:6316_t:CDS:1 n=1 Tax=Funneliformis geosporum TaxID=1117311 RepID=A0A9W4SDI5_9GLOM|nr:5463_t:CDS:2 [Funneliformis geosporum]CAI2165693.1 6316_t:CDS:2 [Funneliformis geosporum]
MDTRKYADRDNDNMPLKITRKFCTLNQNQFPIHAIRLYNSKSNSLSYSFLIRRKLTTSTKTTSTQTETLKGWRKYAAQFRSKPGSYITSFAILHELTAIIPIPLVYIFLSATGIQIPFPQQILDEGNKFINKAVIYYGYPPFKNGSKIALNAATSYAVVKAIMPLRIAACVWMTPWTAERIIGPIMGTFKRIVGKIKMH